MHILLNISRSKGNQTIKFDQLIDYDMRNIFLEKSYAKYGGKASLRLFDIKSKLIISLEQQSEMIRNLFLFSVQVEVCQNILKLRCLPLAFILNKSFYRKQKEVWNQSPHLIFPMIFGEKYLSRFILLTDQISLPDCLYFLRFWLICVM